MAAGAPWTIARVDQMNRAVLGLAVALATLPLAGCATPKLLCFRPSGLKQLTITSDPGSNSGRPIAIDLVFITDKKVLPSIAKLKARDYFQLRDQLRRDLPKGYQARSWELQAGQYVTETNTAPPCNLAGTLLFANYGSDGDHRMALSEARSGALLLGADDFAWSAR